MRHCRVHSQYISVFGSNKEVVSVSCISIVQRRRDRVVMAALPRRFGPDVTDSIMRFAVGYPRDRLKDIMNIVARKEKISRSWLQTTDGIVHWTTDLIVQWKWPGRRMRMNFIMWIDDATYVHLQTVKIADLEWPQRLKVDDLAFTCDACEPVELELQRTQL